MSLKAKYEPVFKLLNDLNAAEIFAEEKNGALNLKAAVKTKNDKDLVMDKIRQIGGEGSRDIKPDISVQNSKV